MRLPKTTLAIPLLMLSLVAGARAELRLPTIFGDHMVLQQGRTVPIWGWATAGEKITVSYAGRTQSSIAAADGKWRVDLPPLLAKRGQATPGTLTVAAKDQKIAFQDVLVGEVWLASGQSNIEFGIQDDANAAKAIAEAKDANIRMFFVPWQTSLTPQENLAPAPADSPNGKWQVCTPEIMQTASWAWRGFSAAGYYFAQQIRQATGAPVGMIGSYKGGTPAESWTSIAALRQQPIFAKYIATHESILKDYAKAEAEFPPQKASYEAAMQSWQAEVAPAFRKAEADWNVARQKAEANGSPVPPKPTPSRPMPQPPRPPDGGYGAPGNLFNGMIAPLIPYGIRGVIWYQGEGNGGSIEKGREYAELFPTMIRDWRSRWKEGDFPFLFVQLANFQPPAKTPSEGTWPWVRESQLKTLALPNTGMAVAIDIGDGYDIHPKDKYHVGLRLSLAARQVAYGEKLTYSGPIYDQMKIDRDSIRLAFRHTDGGLVAGRPATTSKELKGFGIAGKDQKFVWAKAVIEGNTVRVSSDEVTSPVAVRYNWGDNPAGNLYNREGLPASPFRTDDWAP